MINTTSLLTKSLIDSCAISLVGFMGFHAMRWIINKCKKTKKVEQVAQKKIQLPPPKIEEQKKRVEHAASKGIVYAPSLDTIEEEEEESDTDIPQSPLPSAKLNVDIPQPPIPTKRLDPLDITPGKVTMGQGEYIAFHQLPSGEKRQLSPEMFEQVYKILVQRPSSRSNESKRESKKSSPEYANHYEWIKANLKKLDPTLEAVFNPRTLYELFFIRQCIQEDLKHKKICPYVNPYPSYEDCDHDLDQYHLHHKNRDAVQKKKKCWHLAHFTDAGNNEHVGVKTVAYRLNKLFMKTLNPSSDGFTHQELAPFVEKEINFLKLLYNNDKVGALSSIRRPGPTTNFNTESRRDQIKPMGIRHETDAQIIRDAIALDCSKIAQQAFFLYRGGDFQKDSISYREDQNTPYSLSYGSSLFAGCIYDGGATAFHYMRNGKNAYAIPVPFDQVNDSPFFVPTTHTVAQLFGRREFFHARTKAWQGFDIEKIKGIHFGVRGHEGDHLKSHLSKEELTAQFQAYKSNAFQLK